MTSKYKPYSKYKDSGIQWIGEIPEGWKVHRLKFLIETPVTDGPHETPEFISEGIPFLSVDSIQGGKLVFENCRYISEKDHIRFKKKCNPKKNDIFMGKAASIGKIAIVNVNFEFSIWSPLALLRPNQTSIIPKVLEYVLKSDYSQDQIDIFATSNTQKNISMVDIPKMSLIIPPLSEQTVIANFINKKNAKIDALIEKDKKLIGLLEEKRAALINHAVTKGLPVRASRTRTGLDPNVKMKDSGIEWIGEIPENWKAMKLKHIVSRKITDGPHETPEFIDEGVPFISAEAIKKDKIDFSKKRGYITKQVHKIYCAKCKPRKDDIFLIKSGATTGNVAIVETNDEFSIWSPLALIRSNKEKILPKLLYYILLTDYFKKTIELSWSFGTQQNIGMSVIENCNIIIPSISKQNYLLNYLDKTTAKIDKTIQKIEQKINLLEECKKSLIHHTVTGKIDVRGSEI
ncbi:MAG: restriction endonuclease subunit S [Patescibacteria group bacterium]|nr:restriction endonuclease subunit S [Patescibacteria group bacterium]